MIKSLVLSMIILCVALYSGQLSAISSCPGTFLDLSSIVAKIQSPIGAKLQNRIKTSLSEVPVTFNTELTDKLLLKITPQGARVDINPNLIAKDDPIELDRIFIAHQLALSVNKHLASAKKLQPLEYFKTISEEQVRAELELIFSKIKTPNPKNCDALKGYQFELCKIFTNFSIKPEQKTEIALRILAERSANRSGKSFLQIWSQISESLSHNQSTTLEVQIDPTLF